MNTSELIKHSNKAIEKEINFLKSNENLNKNGNRVLVKLEDLRYKTFIRSLKNLANFLDDESEIESFMRESTKKFIEELRVNELLVESGRKTSQTRHAINMEFDKFKRKLVSLGLAFEHPLNANLIVFEELTKGTKENPSKELKPSYKGISINCAFDSFIDDVVKVEKIVKS